MNFIWSGKKPHVKYKIMVDERSRGGLQVPNLQLYHDAVAFTWIKDWLTLHKKRMLNLEGFNIRYGWSRYLCFDESKMDSMFVHHFIRHSLITTWMKSYKRIGTKWSTWVSPLESIDIRFKPNVNLTYKNLLITERGIQK